MKLFMHCILMCSTDTASTDAIITTAMAKIKCFNWDL